MEKPAVAPPIPTAAWEKRTAVVAVAVAEAGQATAAAREDAPGVVVARAGVVPAAAAAE